MSPLTRCGRVTASVGCSSKGMSVLDHGLAADLRARRPGVIADLLAQHGAVIGRIAYLVLRDAADAEEIVMDTLVTAWQRADQLRDDAALRTWLLRIATRHALSRRRRRRPAQPLAAARSLSSEAEPSADRVAVADALAALPRRMRAAVALHHVAGLTVPETADAMGTSQNTVKSQLRDGMARLRAALMTPDAPPAVGRGARCGTSLTAGSCVR